MANKIMTMSEYARHKSVELSAVKRAINEGRIHKSAIKGGSNGRKLIIVADADKMWDTNTIINNKNELRQKSLNLGEKVDKKSPGESEDEAEKPDTGSTKLTEYRAVREGYNAQMAKIDYEKAVGKLCNVEDVRKAATELGIALKGALLNFPDKLAPLLAAETNLDKVHKILSDEMHLALVNLARGNFDFLSGSKK